MEADRLALIRACLANPAEETTRLVLADWFQDQGTKEADWLRREGEWVVHDCSVYWDSHYRGWVFVADWNELYESEPSPRCRRHRHPQFFQYDDGQGQWDWECLRCIL